MRFSVDTNCVNARQSIPAMNQLELWGELELIELMTSTTARNEMASGNNVARKRKAYNFIFSESAVTTDEQRAMLKKIQNILFPNGILSKNEANDVDIVFNSWMYGTKLITNDGGSKKQPGGILGNISSLRALDITVLKPEEAKSLVEQEIKKRDNLAQQWAAYYNKPLPEWVGKD